jgi:hypothetical protein
MHVIINNQRELIKDPIGAGGQASVYLLNPHTAVKIYHDPKIVPSAAKMGELSKIANKQIVQPRSIVFATDGSAIGYTMDFVDGYPVVKLFTRTFKDEHNISPGDVADLVKEIQVAMNDIHRAKCLAVDPNEMNILVGMNQNTSCLTPWFIDVDSFSTPSFRATAIADSIRDRKVSSYKNGHLHYAPNEMSDWFSFAVIAFWLYVNVHPYQGKHPKYKASQRVNQMDDGVSVFHKDVRMPAVANDFSVIPKRHLDWFRGVFLKNDRSVPPLPDASMPIVSVGPVVIQSTDALHIDKIADYGSPIRSVFFAMGAMYVATEDGIYCGKSKRADGGKKVLFGQTDIGTVIALRFKSGRAQLLKADTGDIIGETVYQTEMFSRNGHLYRWTYGGLSIFEFREVSGVITHTTKRVENMSAFSSKMHDGCASEYLLGKQLLVIPYDGRACRSISIPELQGYRILSAKAEGFFVVVIAEKGTDYCRFILAFKDKMFANGYSIRIDPVDYQEANFAVVRGLCALPTENGLELFHEPNQVKLIRDTAVDASMPLVASHDSLYCVAGGAIYRVKSK